MCTMQDALHRFYNDCSAADQQRYTDLLMLCPVSTQLAPNTQAAYLYCPAMYLYCTNDRALPLPVQEWMVHNAEMLGCKLASVQCDAGAYMLRRGSDLEAQVEVLDRQADAVGHSPYISQPDTPVQLVKRIMSAEFGEAVDMSEQYRERQMALGEIFQSLVKGV